MDRTLVSSLVLMLVVVTREWQMHGWYRNSFRACSLVTLHSTTTRCPSFDKQIAWGQLRWSEYLNKICKLSSSKSWSSAEIIEFVESTRINCWSVGSKISADMWMNGEWSSLIERRYSPVMVNWRIVPIDAVESLTKRKLLSGSMHNGKANELEPKSPRSKENDARSSLTLQSRWLIQIDSRNHCLLFRQVANDQAAFTRDSEMLLAGGHVVRFLFGEKTLFMEKSTIVTNTEVLQSAIVRIGNENTRCGLVE